MEIPKQIVITDQGTIETVVKFAAQKNLSNPEGACKLIATAKGRLNATRKYAQTHPRVAAKAEKKAPKAKAAKPAKKAAKAKPAKKEAAAQA